ncbi:MAG TPA: L,D-transpeptidase family protein [Sphingomicrobium sp.]|nr:L,D-transpeptidase family protein [Sphingomicrobium sp.]
MKKLANVLAVMGAFALGVPNAPAHATQSYEARVTASAASRSAPADMITAFGTDQLKPNKYLWRNVPASAGPERIVISIGEQLAYFYRGDTLAGVASVSTGKEGKESPVGVFNVMFKKTMHRSRKYDNAPMPFSQFITDYGIALHAGHNPGEPASRGCIRLPSAFAKKLFNATDVGTPVLIGA